MASRTQSILIVLLAISCLANGWFVYRSRTERRDDASEPQRQTLEERMRQYPFLSRRILMENPQDIVINFTELRRELRRYVETQGHMTGVYFEYLPSGVSVGINDRENFLFASLLKLPIAMGVYKLIENGTITPDTVVTVKPEHIDKGFGDLWERGPGTTLTVSEAITYSLVKSDNTANQLLLSLISPAILGDVFDALDIPKDVESDKLVVSPKGYSSILRSLYLSSYLHEDNSNALLKILSETDFDAMLPAGINRDIKVAHKIGYHSDKQIYTDCGIVYVPKRPYILCVMVADQPYDAAVSTVETISKKVYDFVSQVNPG